MSTQDDVNEMTAEHQTRTGSIDEEGKETMTRGRFETTSVPSGRPSGWKPAQSAPGDFDALQRMSRTQLHDLGLRPWGEPEDEHLVRGVRQGSGVDLSGSPVLWLFPKEWYDQIPNGFPVVTIDFEQELFERGVSDSSSTFGLLPFGILLREPS